MNKLFFNLTIIITLLFLSLPSKAFYKENMLDIIDYNKELKEAIRLFKDEDFDRALPQLEVFARRGDKMSQYMVGLMYLNAQGTKQDLLKSYAWLTVANEQKSQVWLLPLQMLEEKLPSDYLKILKIEGERYLKLYGAKSQRLKCKNVKELGSKKPTHRCKKMEISNGYYFVDHQQNSAILD